MEFKSCIDLRDGNVVQAVGGTLGANPSAEIYNFVAGKDKPASWYAELYKRDGLKGGHIIMLKGHENGNKEAAISALRAYPGGMQIGGVINLDNCTEFLDAGASHVIITSYAFKDGMINFYNLERLREKIGYKRIVLDLSCRRKDFLFFKRYFIVTDSWQKFTKCSVNTRNLETLSGFCDEFLIHGADVEGLRNGVEQDLVEKLGKWEGVHVTYAGGAKSLDDLELVKNLGKGKIDLTIGSALDIFGGKLPYADVVRWHNSQI